MELGYKTRSYTPVNAVFECCGEVVAGPGKEGAGEGGGDCGKKSLSQEQ